MTSQVLSNLKTMEKICTLFHIFEPIWCSVMSSLPLVYHGSGKLCVFFVFLLNRKLKGRGSAKITSIPFCSDFSRVSAHAFSVNWIRHQPWERSLNCCNYRGRYRVQPREKCLNYWFTTDTSLLQGYIQVAKYQWAEVATGKSLDSCQRLWEQPAHIVCEQMLSAVRFMFACNRSSDHKLATNERPVCFLAIAQSVAASRGGV